jgi:restriction endonuclease S subunit
VNWIQIKLGEACTVKRGTTITQKDAVSGDVPVVAGGLKPTYYHNKANRFNSTITISGSGASAGFVNLWKQPIFASDCSTVETKDSNIDINYVYYFLLSNQDFIYKNLRSGAAQPHVYGKDIAEIMISIPPLSTQLKIVNRIDAIFNEVDKALLGAHRNCKNSESLFQSYLNEKLETNEDGWITQTFDEIVADKQVGLVKNSKEQVDDGEYSYFKMNNITNDNRCNLASLVKVNASNEEVKKYKLIKNDFLFNTRNSVELVGKVCIFDGESNDNILYNNNIMRVRFLPSINPYFILYAFSNKEIRKSIEKLKTGATNVAAIYYKDLKDLKIQIPSLEIQNKIVREIETLGFYTNVLFTKSQNKISNYHSLKHSILRQAFSGELVKE